MKNWDVSADSYHCLLLLHHVRSPSLFSEGDKTLSHTHTLFWFVCVHSRLPFQTFPPAWCVSLLLIVSPVLISFTYVLLPVCLWLYIASVSASSNLRQFLWSPPAFSWYNLPAIVKLVCFLPFHYHIGFVCLAVRFCLQSPVLARKSAATKVSNLWV